MDFTEKDAPIVLNPSQGGVGSVQAFKEISVGAGNNILKSNAEGFFVGGTNFLTAPYSQDYNGKIQIRDTNGNVVIQFDPNG